MALQAGDKVGPYEILSLLGQGGMGQVWKARDPRLNRVVAIKTSLVAFNDRFEREARAVAALNHPHICQIYDVGRDYLVMELVDGEPLSGLIKAGPMPVARVADLAAQMADALEEARMKGIVHRDLKPANILITAKGQVKILDFGLAKRELVETSPAGAETVTDVMTAPGTVMGTFPYMSPEQALGEAVDHRSDLFSLGIVLYEMAAGRRPFAGASSVALLHEIVHTAPPPLAGSYSALAPIVGRLLEKDRTLRYQTAGDLLSDLQRLRNRAEPASVRRWWLAIPAAAVLAAGIWFGFFRDAEHRSGEAPTIVPFTTFAGSEASPSFSPDGKHIAYSWDGENDSAFRIYIQRTDATTPLRISNGPGNDSNPVWSPDGGQIAFFRVNGDTGGVYLIPSLGGPERRLTEVSARGKSARLAWSPDGKWLALADRPEGSESDRLYRVSIDNGARAPINTGPDQPMPEFAPAISPDGSRIAFIRQFDFFVEDLFTVPATGGTAMRLTEDRRPVATPAWTPDGRSIVFQSNRTGSPAIWKIPAGGGKPAQMAGASGQIAGLALSRQGTQLAYVESVTDFNIWRMETRPGKDSRPSRVVGSTRLDTSPRYSPDGKRIAYASDRSGSFEIWVANADGGDAAQLTRFGRGGVGSPAWSPDGKWVAFDARPERSPDIYVVSSEGGTPIRITAALTQEVVPSWSRDGQWIYYASDRGGEMHVFKSAFRPQGGAGDAVAVTKRAGWTHQESPDGKYLYFAPQFADGLWRVPVGGGEEQLMPVPLTRRNNRFWEVVEKGIYFASGAESQRPVVQFYDFATGKATPVFTAEKPLVFGYGGLSVSPDGRYILFSQIDQSGSDIVLLDYAR